MTLDLNNFYSHQKIVNYGDVIYSKSFTAFNGFSKSVGAKIEVSVDPDGIIKPGNESFSGVIPGKIKFYTANDDGKLRPAGEFDKSGRLITHEHWSITKSPSGNPLVLMANTDDEGQGPTLNLRRSRGTMYDPKTVKKNDHIFRISWYAHDGQSYKETSCIHSKIEGDVSLGTIPTSISFKIFDQKQGVPTDALKINPDHSISVQSLSTLDNSILNLKSPLGLIEVTNETERDKIKFPIPGTIIFLNSLDTVQVYTKTQGWKSLF